MQRKKCMGSAQIVEFSFVFPLVMLTVLALFYFVFIIFLKVHVYNIALGVADEITDLSGTGSAYWVINGEFVDKESYDGKKENFHKTLNSCRILPGVDFKENLYIELKDGIPRVFVTVDTNISNTSCFKVKVEKRMYEPVEKIKLVEFEKISDCNIERLREIYDSIF